MKIKRTELLEVLSDVKPALASKDIIEQTDCIIFTEGKVCSYNDEISISRPLDLGLQGAVRADELFSFLSKSKEDEIDVYIEEGQLRIREKKGGKAWVVVQEEITIPFDEMGTPDNWKKTPDNFIEAVKSCIFSASTDMTKPVLTCLLLNNSYVLSCDNFRLTKYNLSKSKAFKKPVLLPAFAAKELVKYNVVEYAETEGWVHFRNAQGTIFSARVFMEEYPDVSFLIDVKGFAFEIPEAAQEILELVSIFTKGDFSSDEYATVTLQKGSMSFQGENKYGGYFKRCKASSYKDDKEISFMVNPSFLRDILEHVKDVTIGKTSLKFEGEKFIHVVCLNV